jgi:histidinol-phosphatase
MTVPLSADMDLALQLADLADTITLPRFRSVDLRVDSKADGTPVTDADKRAESSIRQALRERRPDHAVVGEEFGADGDSDWRWYIDPIDGTKNFSRGVPVWATLIALRRGETPMCAVVSAPALRRRWWASRGDGAHDEAGVRLHVSTIASLADAYVSCTDLRDFETTGHKAAFRSLVSRCRHIRAFGDFWSHMLVAEGAIDVGIEPVVNAWDVAAVQLIVEEAGGRFSDFDGAPSIDSGNVVASNGLLHEQVLALMQSR